MAAFGYGREATTGIGAGFKNGIEVGSRLVITRKGIRIKFHIDGGIGDGQGVVLGAHTYFGWQRNFIWQGWAAGHLSKKCHCEGKKDLFHGWEFE